MANSNPPKLIRITTVPQSLRGLLAGQLKFMSNYYEVVGICSSGDALHDVIINEGIRVIPVEMTRTISPLKDIKSVWSLYKIFKKEKPLIVHTHTPKAGISGMLAAKLAGVPYRLHTVAGMPLLVASGRKRVLLDWVEKLTYACATKIYPNSKGLYDIILKNKYTTINKLKVIGKGSSNGIDTSKFDPSRVSPEVRTVLRKELGIAADDFIFLFIGRVVTDKGVNELVESFAAVNNKYPNSHLVIVGRYEKDLDPLEPITEKIIEEHTHIHAVGYRANVVDYFAFADVLTFPSYREGFPNVVMQSAAMQLNAIVSDINGCNEIIRNGNNGWIVPVKDIINLKDRMEWCLKNKKQSLQMGLKSRLIIQADYEQSFVWKEILREYNMLN